MIKPFRSQKILVAVACLLLTPVYFSGHEKAQQPGGPQQARPDGHVIIISIDGLVPDYYMAPARVGLRAPNLTRMKLDGAYAEGVEGIYPSVTYPAHTTIITGVRPATHGIVHNRIFEAPTDTQTREWYWFSKDLKADTLWSVAKKAGLVTAGVGWPVTAGAEIDYNMPEIKDPLENPPTAKRTLQYSTPGLLQDALGPAATSDRSIDGRRTIVAEHIINTYKPRLMLIHLIELDGAHHRYGPRTPPALEVMERLDGYLGRIVEATRKAGTFDKTTFFIVSDHGFAEVSKKFEPNVVLAKEKLITLDANGKPTAWKAAAWPAGGSCAIVLRDPNDKETAAKVASLFKQVAERDNSPLNRVLTAEELKRLGSVPTATLMLEAAPGYSFGEELTGPEIYEPKDYKGTHGQLPTRAEMRSSLVIYGAAARVGSRMPVARMIDIAPTAAGLLGLTLPKAEGLPIGELIKPGLIIWPEAGGKKRRT